MELKATTYTEKINEIVNLVNEGKLPVQMGVLAASLVNDRPDPNPDPDSENLSSAELRNRVGEMCDISLNEVAEVMMALGYSLFIDPISGPLWAITGKQAD